MKLFDHESSDLFENSDPFGSETENEFYNPFRSGFHLPEGCYDDCYGFDYYDDYDYDEYYSPEFPEINSTEIQAAITVINTIERITEGSSRETFRADSFGKLRIMNEIDFITVSEYNDTNEYEFDLDDTLSIIFDCGAAEYKYHNGEYMYNVNIEKALTLRDMLAEYWLLTDLSVEGLNSDGTLIKPILFEEFVHNCEKYKNLNSLYIRGAALENIESGLPVLLSVRDFETAFTAYAKKHDLSRYIGFFV